MASSYVLFPTVFEGFPTNRKACSSTPEGSPPIAEDSASDTVLDPSALHDIDSPRLRRGFIGPCHEENLPRQFPTKAGGDRDLMVDR